jgi:hypothetical protein
LRAKAALPPDAVIRFVAYHRVRRIAKKSATLSGYDYSFSLVLQQQLGRNGLQVRMNMNGAMDSKTAKKNVAAKRTETIGVDEMLFSR